MSGHEEDLAPLTALLAAHGGRDADWHRAVWRLDARLADVVRTTTEPLIGQMRMAWWRDVLLDMTGTKGKGDPLADVLKAEIAARATLRARLVAMVDGWEAFLLARDELDDAALQDFARARGGGLFFALGRDADAPVWIDRAGAVWALWDLSGHVSDQATAERALALAKVMMPDAGRWPRVLSAARIAFGLARHDVDAGRVVSAALTPVRYLRFMRIALFGR